MNTKEQIEQCIKSLGWLKFNIVGSEEPKKNTFEYATKVYLENAIAILKDQESDEVLDIIIKKRVNIGQFIYWSEEDCERTYKDYLRDYDLEGWWLHYRDNVESDYKLTETEFNKIKERLVK